MYLPYDRMTEENKGVIPMPRSSLRMLQKFIAPCFVSEFMLLINLFQ